MISRLFVSSTLALLALYGATAPAFAASDRDNVMLGTAGVVIALMAIITVIYAVKWYFGAAGQPPAPVEDDHAHGHGHDNVAESHEDPEVEPPHGTAHAH